MPHGSAAWRLRPTVQEDAPSAGLLAKCPPPLLALAIETGWRKRAAGVAPAQPRVRPEGQRQTLQSQNEGRRRHPCYRRDPASIASGYASVRCGLPHGSCSARPVDREWAPDAAPSRWGRRSSTPSLPMAEQPVAMRPQRVVLPTRGSRVSRATLRKLPLPWRFRSLHLGKSCTECVTLISSL